MTYRISAAILAGGQARRLGGVIKGLIPVEGKPIIQKIVEMISPMVEEIIIISNDPQPYQFLNLPVFPDDEAGHGPLQGIITALRKVSLDHLLVIPCDMPFITQEAIRTLVTHDPAADAVIPLSRKGQEPLFAVYSKTCIAPAARALRSGKHRVISFLPDVRTTYIPADRFEDSLWFNINNHADLQIIQTAV